MYNLSFQIGNRIIRQGRPVYFIADIGANHDGDLKRAIELIKLAADAGADCVKFQHFRAKDIVSAKGFEGLKVAHQAKWDKPIYKVYEDYSINRDWDETLYDTCREAGVEYMTTPYDFAAVDSSHRWVKAYKIGSGDITYLQLIDHIAKKKLPIFLATGASNLFEVEAAVATIMTHNSQLCLMQCNTNYTGSIGNFRHVNLKVLETYAKRWPGLPLGLSDHTPGHVAALAAVALGACVIEKHFTDDVCRRGPDHTFAMTPEEWRKMVINVSLVQMALGTGIKDIEENERESVIVQRRALRLKDSHFETAMIIPDMLEALRPCPVGAYTPAQIDEIVGRRINKTMEAGQEIYPGDLA